MHLSYARTARQRRRALRTGLFFAAVSVALVAFVVVRRLSGDLNGRVTLLLLPAAGALLLALVLFNTLPLRIEADAGTVSWGGGLRARHRYAWRDVTAFAAVAHPKDATVHVLEMSHRVKGDLRLPLPFGAPSDPEFSSRAARLIALWEAARAGDEAVAAG